MLRMPWHRISEVRPLASSLRIPGRGPAGGPQPRIRDHPVEEDDAEDPEHTEFLADHRQDEIGLGLGQVEDLLDRLAEADAEQAARAERDLTLHGLEAGGRLRGPGVQERGQPRLLVGLDAAPSAAARPGRSAPAARGGGSGSRRPTSSAVSENAITSVVPRSGSATHEQAGRPGGDARSVRSPGESPASASGGRPGSARRRGSGPAS